MSCLVVLAGCHKFSSVPQDSFSSSLTPALSSVLLDPPFSLAVLPFENVSRQAHLSWLGRGLQEMLVSDLAKWPQFEVISRDALGPVLREQWLQQRGFSSAENPVKLGQVKGVRYLIQGRIYTLDTVLGVDLQIVDVETGVVVASANSQGKESEIFNLEQDLVTHVLRLFGTSSTLKNQIADEPGRNTQTTATGQGRIDENMGELFSTGQYHSHSVHQIDAFLSLEKLTQQRSEAYRLAEMIWNEGWTFEMGQPFYTVRQIHNPFKRYVPIMEIPISVFFSSRRLTDIFARAPIVGSDHGVHVNPEGFRINLENVSESSRLFVEHFYRPRRVFVRALNEQGNVLAVFSDWAWRTDTIIYMQESQWDSIPMWPKPFVRGVAQFLVHGVGRENSQVAFDVMVAPVPDEQTIVKVEILRESEESKKGFERQAHPVEALLQTLEKLIQLRWTPAISEGLPIAGYLPGNKRTAMGVVHFENGKIVQVKFQKSVNDPFFLKSLDDLESNLLGYCVECQDQGEMLRSPSHFSEPLRLQLTLVKDTHFLQLGSSPH